MRVRHTIQQLSDGLRRPGVLWRFLSTRYLVTSSTPLLIAHGISALMGLGRSTLLANYLPKDSFGEISYLLNWLAVLSLAALSGMDLAIAQYVAKGHWEVIRLGIRRRLLAAILPMTALVIFGWVGGRLEGSEVAPPLWYLTAVFFPTSQIMMLVGGILGALKQFRRLAIYYVGQSAAFLAATGIGLWLWPGQQAVGIVLFQWLLLSVLNGAFWLQIHRPDDQTTTMSPTQRRQFFRFGSHITVLNAISQAKDRIGALLLGSFVSFTALAEYAIGDLVLEQMRSLWGIYYGVSYPRLITLGTRDRWRQVRREMLLVTPAFAALSAIAGIGLSAVIPWLFSAKYAASLTYVWLLLLAFVCSIPGGFFEMYFRVEETQRSLYTIRVVSAIVGVVLPPLLLVMWGPLGVPVARAGANAIYSVAGFVLYRQHRTRVYETGETRE